MALGGGSARGFANIGVLKVLDREKIPVDLIIGSSMGAFVGAVYALGRNTDYMQSEANKFTLKDITDLQFPSMSVLKGEKLRKKVYSFIGDKMIEDCIIPLAITATDIKTGDEHLFTKGNLAELVTASCSWPGFFPPVEIEGKLLADGGMRNSVPVKWAESLGATFNIAVKVGFEPQKIDVSNIFALMAQSVQIMGEELDKYQSMQADVIIEPDLSGITQLDFHKAQEIIERGEEAANEKVREIKRKLRI